jgi:Zn-dependent peptidase ImmA (M78 family)
VNTLQVNSPDAVTRKAASLIRRYHTRNPWMLADELNITVQEHPFKRQKGVYTIIKRNRYIFLKEDLDPVTKDLVLLHEIGHDQLHRRYASQKPFSELQLFSLNSDRLEYEANLLAAQLSLPEDELLEYVYRGYDDVQIARAMHSDSNLVAMRVAALCRQKDYAFRIPEHKTNVFKD